MNKDVIYIDIEDDITAIIEKVKAAGEKIVALVPPKGNAVLQSVVNLKLLKRAATGAGKQAVIVTNNQALTALAGGLGLYVAKNLQTKPAIPNTNEDVAEAEEAVEVSDEATPAESVADTGTTVPLADSSDSDEVELSGEELAALDAEKNSKSSPASKPKGKAKKDKNKKIPNFNKFRKKLIIGGILLVAVLVALFFIFGRGKANIVIRAETTPVDVAFAANLNANANESDPETYNLKAVLQEQKQTLTQSFTPTGERDIGRKASGRARFSTGAISSLGTTIPAGTRLTTSNDLVFVTTESVTINLNNYNNAPVGIEAAESGPRFNGARGNMSGAPRNISTTITQSPSGGTTQIVKIVSQEDINRARAQLEQQDTNAIREELRSGFDDDVTVLEDSFTVSLGNIRSEPGAGEQSNEARVTAESTASMLGVSNRDLGAALDAFITTQMPNKDQQRVYENGRENVKFEKVSQDGTAATYNISTLAHYGPQFDTEQLKQESEGKKIGEVRAYLQDLPGVKGVDINLSPFWSRTLPGADRIEINLEVDQTTGA